MTLYELKIYKPNPMDWDWNDFNSLRGDQLQLGLSEQARAMRDIHQKVIKFREEGRYNLGQREADQFIAFYNEEEIFP